MNIGEAALAAGVSAKMVRHYEAIGLVPQPQRTNAGYRVYDGADVQRLIFIRHARAVGFATEEIRQLLSLWSDQKRAARDVKRLATEHLERVHARMRELELIAASLGHLLQHCQGDERPDCPILESLARKDAPARTPRGAAKRRQLGEHTALRRVPPARRGAPTG